MKFRNVYSGLIIAIMAALFCLPALAADESASGEINGKCGATPQQPSIPNGLQASKDEMLAALDKIHTYQAESKKYRGCIDGLMSTWAQQTDPKDKDAVTATNAKKDIAITFYNKSVDDEKEVADLFNSAIRAFKGKK